MVRKMTQAVTFEVHDVSNYEMEDEEVLELFRRNSGVRPEVSSKNFPDVSTVAQATKFVVELLGAP